MELLRICTVPEPNLGLDYSSSKRGAGGTIFFAVSGSECGFGFGWFGFRLPIDDSSRESCAMAVSTILDPQGREGSVRGPESWQ